MKTFRTSYGQISMGIRTLLVVLLASLLANAPGAQPGDPKVMIANLINEGSPTSLKGAVKGLADGTTLTEDDRVSLWSDWLDAVQTKLADQRLADDLLVEFLSNLPKSQMSTKNQTYMARAWAANERRVGRSGRMDQSWPSYAAKSGSALVTWCASLEKAQDQKFNSEDRPWLNPPPPPGSNISPGSDPAAITDPVLREQYRKIVEDNVKKTTYFSQQILLQRETEQAAESVRGWVTGISDVRITQKIRQAAVTAKLSDKSLKAIFSEMTGSGK